MFQRNVWCKHLRQNLSLHIVRTSSQKRNQYANSLLSGSYKTEWQTICWHKWFCFLLLLLLLFLGLKLHQQFNFFKFKQQELFFLFSLEIWAQSTSKNITTKTTKYNPKVSKCKPYKTKYSTFQPCFCSLAVTPLVGSPLCLNGVKAHGIQVDHDWTCWHWFCPPSSNNFRGAGVTRLAPYNILYRIVEASSLHKFMCPVRSRLSTAADAVEVPPLPGTAIPKAFSTARLRSSLETFHNNHSDSLKHSAHTQHTTKHVMN